MQMFCVVGVAATRREQKENKAGKGKRCVDWFGRCCFTFAFWLARMQPALSCYLSNKNINNNNIN